MQEGNQRRAGLDKRADKALWLRQTQRVGQKFQRWLGHSVTTREEGRFGRRVIPGEVVCGTSVHTVCARSKAVCTGVGKPGFEPGTSRSQTARASQLRYSP